MLNTTAKHEKCLRVGSGKNTQDLNKNSSSLKLACESAAPTRINILNFTNFHNGRQ